MTGNSHRSPRALVIALDAASPTLLRGWMKSGDLPNLAAIARSGVTLPIETLPGIGDDGTWQTITTGLPLGEHGRWFLRTPARGEYVSQYIHGTGLAGPVFWDAIANEGKTVAVLDVPKTADAEHERVSQVVDWLAHGRYGPKARMVPAGCDQTLLGAHAAAAHPRCDVDPFAAGAALSPREMRDEILAMHDAQHAVFSDALRTANDLFVCAYAATHCAGHALWQSLPDNADAAWSSAEALAADSELKDVYRAVDASVGELLGRWNDAGPVVVFTPLGIGPNYSAHMPLEGYLEARDRSLESNAERLRRWGYRVRRAFAGDAELDRLDPFEPAVRVAYARRLAHRKAYCLPHNEISGAVRVNLTGREPQGRVPPGKDYERFVEDLAADLESLVDPDSGRSVVERVVATRREYSGRGLDRMPDLLVVWDRSRPISGLACRRYGEFRIDRSAHRSGGHDPNGLLIADSVELIDAEIPMTYLDFAPTLAALCGAVGGERAGSVRLRPA